MSRSKANPSDETGSRGGRFRRSGLLPRTLVALVGVPLLVSLGLLGGHAFLVLVLTIILLGQREFYQLAATRGYSPHRLLGMASGLALALALGAGAPLAPVLTGVVLLTATATLRRSDPAGALRDTAVTLFGVVYVAWLGIHIALLRDHGADGNELGARALGLLAAVTWSCDTAAYLVGVSIGRRPLVPMISPKKSREGALGGLLAAGGAGWLSARTFAAPLMDPGEGLALGLVCGVAAQLGDLVVSQLKRDAGAKDTAELLPGHGGVLDRFDSVLFTAPIIYNAVTLGWVG